ncbi:hypothetical protein AB0O34_06835 [Sphaerisporangium sp. NPDC088356]|uniref:hypothetical protein n=1 Tax=Sphaerisporangium sp. NPDC088356 TaxID=3154871 RepID=UPI0034484FF5
MWLYDPKSETVTLKTIFGVNPDPSKDTDYDGPDNITVFPYGGPPGYVFAITGPWRRPSDGGKPHHG